MPTDPLQEEQLASDYGWALAVLKSSPELYSLFKQAVAGSTPWTAQRFVAKLRDTKWYKTHSEASRQAEILKTADPAEWTRRVRSAGATVNDMWQSLTGQGAGKKTYNLAVWVATYQPSESEIRDMIQRSFRASEIMKTGGLGGTLGEAERSIRQAAEDYGVSVSEGWIGRRVNQVAMQQTDVTATQNFFRQAAKRKYAAFSDELDAGMTMREIAEPFRQLMAKTLEVSDKSITVTDKTLEKALTYRPKGKDGKPGAPTGMALWQFEENLKKDPRWMKTNNARDSLMEVGHQVLRDFGFSGAGN